VTPGSAADDLAASIFILKKEAVRPSETLVSFRNITGSDNPEDIDLSVP